MPLSSQKCELGAREDPHRTRQEFNNQYQQSPIPSRKLLSPTNKNVSPTIRSPTNEEMYGGGGTKSNKSNRNLHGNTSPIGK